jgi:arginyl-tRNA--protein-N-Asp/Glu arginylyltransferase
MSSVTFCRIDLSKTNYTQLDEWKFIITPNFEELDTLYTKYCKHKQFESVMPLFREQFDMPNTDLIGYYDNNQLVAYSLVLKYDASKSVVAERFVWDYDNPKLRLGIRSLEHECALYKQLGYEYLYLGEYVEYKSSIGGFELLGPR